MPKKALAMLIEDEDQIRRVAQLHSALTYFDKIKEEYETRTAEVKELAEDVRDELDIVELDAAMDVTFRLPDGLHTINFPKDRITVEHSVEDFLNLAALTARNLSTITEEEQAVLFQAIDIMKKAMLVPGALKVVSTKVPTPYKHLLKDVVVSETRSQMRPKRKS